MTFYQDMQELLVLSNILITDYSSSMFDYAYLKKLCILYVSDLEQYKSSERSLYFDIEKLPFLISKDNDSLENQIMSFDENIYANRIENFIKQIGSYENGDACEQIYNKVFKEK
jgi:CDP-glycerol glycerophosphotransferase